jgi:hypothetical protein
MHCILSRDRAICEEEEEEEEEAKEEEPQEEAARALMALKH